MKSRYEIRLYSSALQDYEYLYADDLSLLIAEAEELMNGAWEYTVNDIIDWHEEKSIKFKVRLELT